MKAKDIVSELKEENEKISENVLFLSEKEIEEIRQKAKEDFFKKRHKWRQKGNWLVCVGCENRHAFWIGREKIMVGEDKNGNPILKDRKKVF